MDQEERLKHGLIEAARLMHMLASVHRAGVEVYDIAELMSQSEDALIQIEHGDSMTQTLAFNQLIEVRRQLETPYQIARKAPRR